MQKDILKLSFPEVRIVEASAGSGKTYALARRYLQLLINSGSEPENLALRSILAITFTNKAAREMKERILEFLKKIALNAYRDEKEKGEILGFLDVDEKTAGQKAFLALEYIMRNYNFFQVETIDSFINALLVGCAFRLNISANFRIKDDYGRILSFCLDKLIDCALKDKDVAALLENFLRQYLYLENKKGWLARKEMLSSITDLFSQSNIFGRGFKKFPVKSKDIFAVKKNIIIELEKINAEFPRQDIDARFFNALDKLLDESKGYFDIKRFSELKSLVKEDLPVKKGRLVTPKMIRIWDKVKSGIAELGELEAFSLYNCYIDIFEPVLHSLTEISSSEDTIYLEELNRYARGLFDEQSIPVSEFYYRLASRFKHYLIDEFQDTSLLQWKNIRLLVEEALSTGGTLFCVGDRKQAIYRFRGGEVLLFNLVKEDFTAFEVRLEALKKNYRSQREIVEFNNEIFSLENLNRFIGQLNAAVMEKDKNSLKLLNENDTVDINSVFQDARQEYKKGLECGYVNIERLENDDSAEMEVKVKERLMALLDDLKERFSYSELAILCRSNKEVALVSEWLIAGRIPVESEKTLDISENPLIKELVSFIKFLNSPVDNLSFASFILGDIFQKASGLKEEDVREFLFKTGRKAALSAVAEKIYYYREFRNTYPDIWEQLIEEFFKNAGLLPLYEFTGSIFGKFRVFENYPDSQGFFMRFLELIKQQEKDYRSAAEFMEFFESAQKEHLYVDMGNVAAVKVLTIHKAKGLEFSVVIIPFFSISTELGGRSSNKGNVSYLALNEKEGILLMRMNTAYAVFSRELKNRYRDEYKKVLSDELNNAYVAFTRAKNELYIFIPQRISGRFNAANFFVPEEVKEKGKASGYKASAASQKSKTLEIPPSAGKDWIGYMRDEFISQERIRFRGKIIKGELMHYALSLLGNLSRADEKSAVSHAAESAKIKFAFFENREKIHEEISRLLEMEACKKFFYAGENEVFNEKEVINKYGQTRRIDRLLVLEKEVWVIDYKSSRDMLPEYEKQLREYAQIIAQLYPRKKIRGFLLYLDEKEVQEVQVN